ncbi:hypothetical protein Acr_00g0094190 [Actinidia rufa]|uniref:Uncharacterized protein n=1 Tax=Actinidia rufa TaxID=165716 RepID=A0A7J0DY22_9ERIC|nr:hypothetical protein Acr_00g0094190 [Actinidia rufa]
MASTTARRLFQISPASARSFLSRNGRVRSPPSVASAGRRSCLSSPPSPLHQQASSGVGLWRIVDAASLCYCFCLAKVHVVFEGWPMGFSL